jgi:bacillopeptidase F
MRGVTVLCVVVMVFSAVSMGQPGIEHQDIIAAPLHLQLRKHQFEPLPIIVSMRDHENLKAFRGHKRTRITQLVRALKDRADRDQAPLKKWLRQQGIVDTHSLWINNSLVLSAPPEVIDQLSQRPEIAAITLDEVIFLGDTPSAQTSTPEWHLNAIEAPFLWSLGFDGTGVVIAGMDTGVDYLHPDLASRWRGGTNSWKDVFEQHPQPYDAHGHGTQTMGIMLGGDNSGADIGVAPGAQWIAVKIFDDAGHTTYSKIHEGFQWLLDPDDDPNTLDAPDIVNNSWGLNLAVNQCITEFDADVNTLKAAGIAVVFAAGNAGPLAASSVSPANNPANLSVGAINETGIIASFSSRGPSPCHAEIFPSLTAPGVNIKTADLTGGGAIPNSYAYVSGTSYATAVVSGAMALLLSAFSDIDIARLEKAMLLSSGDMGEIGPDYMYGNGILNAAVAYEYAATVCPGDIEADYAVNMADLMILMEEWLNTNCIDCTADLNKDLAVDLHDFALIAQHFGKDPCPAMCSGDINTNYRVEMSDLIILASDWLNPDCFDCPGNINKDGSVDFLDYAVFSGQFGEILCW